MYKDELNELLNKTFKELGYDIETSIKLSDRPDLCDYQSNDVFKVAKEYHKNPIEVGESIANELSKHTDYFSKVEFVKPGFINMSLSNEFINKYVMITNKNIKDTLHLPKEETYVIDYGGPNIAKPLHVGHMRTAIVGEAMKRILKYMGNKVIADTHLGDYGLQIGEVIYACIHDGKDIDDIDIKYLDEAYPRMSKLCKEDEAIMEECQTITKDLQEGNEYYQKLWKKIYDVSLDDIKSIYKYLDVDFDLWYGESDAYPYIPIVEKKLEPFFVESEGAIVIPVEEETDNKEVPPLIYKKSNGAYLYATTDLGTIEQRVEDYNPDHIIYVTDLRQALHFEQVFRVVDKAGIISKDKLEHQGYGTVNGEDGKPYKTRNGDTPKLSKLFEETKEIFINKKESNKDMSNEDIDKIVNAILKFGDLQNSIERDYIFNIEKFSDIQGKTGPYLLYTYLRLNKVVKNYDMKLELSNNIYNEQDRNLGLKLLELPNILESAFIDRRPNYIADYLYNLSVIANTFYQNNYLSKEEDKDKLNDYLVVLDTTCKVLKELLNLLAIQIPSVM